MKNLPILLTKIYNYYLPSNSTDVYLFCAQECTNDSMFFQLKNIPEINNILILDASCISGYIGFDKIKNILINQYKINSNKIIRVPFLYENEKMINTYNESLSLSKYLYDNHINDLIIIAPVFHLPRATITLISVIINTNTGTKIYPLSGKIFDWKNNILLHSQGTLRGNVNELFEKEILKIEEYTNKGDLLVIEKILEYMQK